MKLDADTLRLSATDLANHLACRHLTTLARGEAEGLWKAPDWYRPETDVLRQRGLEHEKAYLAHRERGGLSITRLSEAAPAAQALAQTLEAMRSGAPAIAQATLASGRWFGRADLLLRVEVPSQLGAWSYEPLDTKLARETRAGAILQLCLYAELLEDTQGVLPERMYVVPRLPELEAESYRVADYLAYHRLVRHRLEAAADEGGAPGEAGSGEASEEKEEGFTNVIALLAGAFPHAAWAHFLEHYEIMVFSLFIALLLLLVAFLASRNPQLVPSGLQNGVEMVVEGLSGFFISIIGPKNGPRFVPFLGTLFIYILSMNLFGLIPFMHSPTASLNVTVALALTVFVYVQFIGFKELGPIGWLDHMLGSPRDLTGWLLAPLMLPIHMLGELAKPISLSCRLFGNIFGEDMLLVAFASLGIAMLPFQQVPFGVPMQAIFYPLVLLGGFLQAMVFTVLSTIYILLMLPHEHHDEHGHEEAAHHAH